MQLMSDKFSFVSASNISKADLIKNFRFYFGNGRFDFRYAGFIYDYGFDLVQSESYIFIDFGFKRQIKFFLPFFFSFYPFLFKSSSLLFWKELKYLLYKSLPIKNFSTLPDVVCFSGSFPFNFYNVGNFLFRRKTNFSDVTFNLWSKKQIKNKLSYDFYLDIDSHLSLSLSSGGINLMRIGYLSNHFLGIAELSLIGEFKSGPSFFLRSFDNLYSRLSTYYFKPYHKFMLTLKNTYNICNNFFLPKFYNKSFNRIFLNTLIRKFLYFIWVNNFLFKISLKNGRFIRLLHKKFIKRFIKTLLNSYSLKILDKLVKNKISLKLFISSFSVLFNNIFSLKWQNYLQKNYFTPIHKSKRSYRKILVSCMSKRHTSRYHFLEIQSFFYPTVYLFCIWISLFLSLYGFNR